MTCRLCKERGKAWPGDDPRCAFEEGYFGDNWNCATANHIRDIVYEGQNPMPPGVDYQYCEDMKYATVRLPDGLNIAGQPMALWVSWYKSRGETDAMWLLFCDREPRRPTAEECEEIIIAFNKYVEYSA